MAVVITALAAAVTFAFMVWLLRYAKYNTIFADPQMSHRLQPRMCKKCDGRGDQWLDTDGSGWGPLPASMRSSGKDVELGHGVHGLGNTRTCPGCHGAGHTWRAP